MQELSLQLLSLALGLMPGRVETPVYFDMGTETSAVQVDHVRAIGQDDYSPGRGWGFEGDGPSSFLLVPQPGDSVGRGYTRAKNFELLEDDLKRDGVRGERIVFRVDVEPGMYSVSVTLGDLLTSMGSVRLIANGRLVRKNIAFQHAATRAISGSKKRASGGQGCFGMYDVLRFEVEAPEGVLRIELDGDQGDYDRRLKEEKAGPRLRSWINGREMDHDVAPYRNIGEPFVDVPLLGIEIARAASAPVRMAEGGELKYVGGDKGVERSVAAFCAKEFEQAAKALKENRGEDHYARGLCYMWLAGWLEYSGGESLAQKAVEELQLAVAQDPHHPGLRAAIEDCLNFNRALAMHLQRGDAGKSHFTENQKAHHFFALIHEASPLYWRARFYGARCALQLDPHRWISSGQLGLAWFKEIKKAFPDNPQAIYYTTDVHDPEQGPWRMRSFEGLHRDTDPQWAKSLHSAYSHILALSEWWIENRQQPDGSLGGGLDDDVELVGLFGYYAAISPGANRRVLAGVTRLIERLYRDGGGIDPEAGYAWEVGDSEHTAELTGNTLPLMMVIDYGNPLWIERAMKVGKLFRDVWTAKTVKGHRHFRSNFTGALGVGGGPTANDSIINRRCIFPAERVLWYNGHPAIREPLLEWAEAWLEDSLRTDKGKPRGFLPSNIGFETEEMNGVDAPSWHTGFDPRRRSSVNYHFGAYYSYHLGLMELAYDLTGDVKFLEPARLGAAYYAELGHVEADWSAAHGSPAKIKWALREAHKHWNTHLGEPLDLTGLDQPRARTYNSLVAEYEPILDALVRSWPILTEEASATDRLNFHGITRVLEHYTGGGRAETGEISLGVTYEGAGRDFASMVIEASRKRIDLALYRFAEDEAEVRLLPWSLEPGSRYRVTVATDLDHDGRPDDGGASWTVLFENRGQAIPLKLNGRLSYLIEVVQTSMDSTQPGIADLGLSRRDVEYDAERGIVTVRIHNTGTAAAENVDVLVYQGRKRRGKPLAKLRLPHISWPMQLDAQTVKLGFRYVPKSNQEVFTVVIDPQNTVREITEVNNRLATVLRFGQASKRAGSKR